MLFRTQNNVPEIYVDKSRDFQLLGRLKDVIFGGVKYEIDSLNHTSNTMEMNSTLLPLLKSKVGFFEYEELTEDQLRHLLAGFPDVIKYKGSRKGIEKALFLWFRVNKIEAKLVSTLIDNAEYKIILIIDSNALDTRLLDEIFKYILPTGYSIEYRFATNNGYNSVDYLIDKLEHVTMYHKDNSVVKHPDTSADKLTSQVGFTQILTPSNSNPSSDSEVTTSQIEEEQGDLK